MTQDHLSVAIEFTVPVRIESVNRTRDHHWSVRKRKTDAQRYAVAMVWRSRCGPQKIDGLVGARFVVTLTRIAPRRLDDDNNIAGLKACRDEVADILGVNDGDENRIKFVYEQAKGRPKEYAAKIRIETTEGR